MSSSGFPMTRPKRMYFFSVQPQYNYPPPQKPRKKFLISEFFWKNTTIRFVYDDDILVGVVGHKPIIFQQQANKIDIQYIMGIQMTYHCDQNLFQKWQNNNNVKKNHLNFFCPIIKSSQKISNSKCQQPQYITCF